MRRYFLYLKYKGTSYKGWQVQPGKPTIQAEIERVLSILLQNEVCVTGAGRTDTGVHAEMMVAHFDSEISPGKSIELIYKLNRILPADISVQDLREVKTDSHARFNAISRTYQYRIATRKNPFLTGLRTYIYDPIDLDAMNKSCSYMIDYKDFTSFSKLHTDVKTNICNIQYAHWYADDYGIIFEIKANRFLRNMVRAIVGTQLEIGRKKLEPEEIRTIIEKKDRSAAGKSVKAEGLFLTAIDYPDEVFI